MYAATPSLLIGWIPIVNIAVAVWTYVLLIIGIRENQEMSTRRAILVVIAPLVLTLVLYAGIIVLIGDLARVYPLTGAGG
ncbi:MAG TPA: YIP1 family protein, partial [Methanoregula sp.]|nr:YIP1 family protein [Methanoregula sp.]